MKTFYSFLLAWAEIDLAIAKGTGRNSEHIAQLIKECSVWEHELLMLEINTK